MPLYDYRCRACGETFDRLRSTGDADAAVACTCGSEDTARMPSMIARPTGGGDPLPMAAAPQPSAGGCCGGGCCS